MARTKVDPLDIVEAAYDVDAMGEPWLKRLAEAVLPHLDGGFGVAAFEFYRPEGQLPRIVSRYHLGIPGPLERIYPTVFDTMDPDIRQRPFRMGPCVTGSQLVGMRDEFKNEPHMQRHVHRFGMLDSIWITAAEPSGLGCGFHAGRRTIGRPRAHEVRFWGRIAAHLATAVRLRARLNGFAQQRAAATEAILDPEGKIHEASGPASTRTAREVLRRAVLMVEQARGPLRRTDPNDSLAKWRALVAGRWSLVDQIEHDGRRYVVARQNDPTAPGPDALTAREKQVIALAKLGHHNKLIAYELGIADSTVRVLLTHASAKLGVHGREELIDGFTERESGPERPDRPRQP